MADAAAFDFAVKTVTDPATGKTTESIQVLDSVLRVFENAAGAGFLNLKPEALWLIGVFAIINICTTWALYDGELRLSRVISQIMKIGAFYFLIMNMGKINNAIMLSFQGGGLIAALGQADATSYINGGALTPSGLLDQGIGLTEELWKIDTGGTFDILGKLEKFAVVCLVIFSYFVMSIQLMLTKIEFNIFASIAVILLPFGVIRFTQFLFQRAVSAVFAFGIKLMLCYFMLGIVSKQTENLKNGFGFISNGGHQMSFGLLISAALGYVAIGYLVWKVPNIVSGMMNGQPALDGNGIARKAGQTAAGVASGAASAVAKTPGRLMRLYGYTSATARTAANNARSIVNTGNTSNNINPSKGRYAWEFTKQLARQEWASSTFGRNRISGANKALGRAEDYANLDTGAYKRRMQRNRNN